MIVNTVEWWWLTAITYWFYSRPSVSFVWEGVCRMVSKEKKGAKKVERTKEKHSKKPKRSSSDGKKRKRDSETVDHDSSLEFERDLARLGVVSTSAADSTTKPQPAKKRRLVGSDAREAERVHESSSASEESSEEEDDSDVEESSSDKDESPKRRKRSTKEDEVEESDDGEDNKEDEEDEDSELDAVEAAAALGDKKKQSANTRSKTTTNSSDHQQRTNARESSSSSTGTAAGEPDHEADKSLKKIWEAFSIDSSFVNGFWTKDPGILSVPKSVDGTNYHRILFTRFIDPTTKSKLELFLIHKALESPHMLFYGMGLYGNKAAMVRSMPVKPISKLLQVCQAIFVNLAASNPLFGKFKDAWNEAGVLDVVNTLFNALPAGSLKPVEAPAPGAEVPPEDTVATETTSKKKEAVSSLSEADAKLRMQAEEAVVDCIGT
jgi:hypothetical protein